MLYDAGIVLRQNSAGRAGPGKICVSRYHTVQHLKFSAKTGAHNGMWCSFTWLGMDDWR